MMIADQSVPISFVKHAEGSLATAVARIWKARGEIVSGARYEPNARRIVARENAKAVVLNLVKQKAAGIADGDMPESLFHRGKMVVTSTFWRYKDRRTSGSCPLSRLHRSLNFP
jgi:hypothetical protein